MKQITFAAAKPVWLLELIAAWGYLQRNYYLTKRYFMWELVWFAYSTANTMSIGYIGAGVADPQIRNAGADRADYPGKVAAKDVRELDTAAAIGAAAEPHLVIGCVDAGRVNVDYHLARPGSRVRRVSIA